MNRFWSYFISLAAIGATLLLLTVKDPYEGSGGASATVPLPPPVAIPALVEAPEPPPPPPPSWFALQHGEGLSLLLSGTVPREEIKSSLLDSARRASPELVKVRDQLEVNPAAADPSWLSDLPDLVTELLSTVQDPELRLERTSVRIGGVSGDEKALVSLRGRFDALFAEHPKREDRLRHDETKPAPEIRMPLVLYLGPLEGKYSFEGSLPTAEQRKAVREAAIKAVGAERFADHLRVSPSTIAEPWLAGLPPLVNALLDEKHGAMELIVVDRTMTVKGEVPDEGARKKLLDLANPAREAGYAVVDGLTVKKK